jgi:hypothetical protein
MSDKDVYDLTDEEYAEALNQGLDQQDQDDDFEETDEGRSTYDQADETDLGGQDTTQDEDPLNQRETEQKITLIHNGQAIEVTQQEAINLAQKGYDYEKKTSQLAPHRRLIELVEGDEELQSIINRHVIRKTMPAPSKREDFDSEDDWFRDNMEKVLAKTTPIVSPRREEQEQTTAPNAPTGQGGQVESPIVRALRQRDPQHFETVKPVLVDAIKKLTVDEYSRITQSATEVVKFYDKVKSEVVAGGNSGGTAAQRGGRTFNLRGGGGVASRPAPRKNVWELSNKDFNEQIRKAKGY